MEAFASEPGLPARSTTGRQDESKLIILPLESFGGPARLGMTVAQVARLFDYSQPVAAPEPKQPEPVQQPVERAPKPVHPRPARPAARVAPRRHFRSTGLPHRHASGAGSRADFDSRPPARVGQSAPVRRERGWLYRISTRATSALLVVSLMLGWAVLSLTIAQHVWGYNSYVVLSGSMRPTIPVGTLVLDQPVSASKIVIGDVVSFHPAGNPDLTVTHRVVEVKQDPPGTHPGLYAKTKGDANPVEDPGLLPLQGQVNRVVVWVPYAGFGVAFLEQPGVRVLLVLLPLALMATLLLSALWRSPR
jgi:signal peptidase I